MNYGPIIFLMAFLAMAGSWFGLVLTPHVQLGQMQPTNSVPDRVIYPVSRPGLAREGLEVFRANGCAYCHSQQAQQTGTTCDVAIIEAGTNQAAAIQALIQVGAAATEGEAQGLLAELPKRVRRGLSRDQADAEIKVLAASGLKTDLLVLPTGPDIARAWGVRRSVAEDFLYDSPVMPGSQRIGPDLANVGMRQPDANWHLQHLYDPQAKVPGSLMPPYRNLFEKQHVGKDYEMVPTREANALVSYLLSLRNDTALFSTPMKVTMALPQAATNAAAGATNAPGSGTPNTNAVAAPK